MEKTKTFKSKEPVYDLYKKAVYVIDGENISALRAMQKIAAAGGLIPGNVIRVTRDEFLAIKNALIMIVPSPTEETDKRSIIDLPV